MADAIIGYDGNDATNEESISFSSWAHRQNTTNTPEAVYTANAGDRITKMWANGRSWDVTDPILPRRVHLAVYTITGTAVKDLVATGNGILMYASGWYSQICDIALTAGTTYGLCAGQISGGTTYLYWKADTSSPGDGPMESDNNNTFLDPFQRQTTRTRTMLMYGEITFAAAPATSGGMQVSLIV